MRVMFVSQELRGDVYVACHLDCLRDSDSRQFRLQPLLPTDNLARAQALSLGVWQAALHSAKYSPSAKISGGMHLEVIWLGGCVQIDSRWNGFVYVCDGAGKVSGIKAKREQVLIPHSSL